MILGGFLPQSNMVNRAKMMLLSKEKTSVPPINRIRPIQMYIPLRKALEGLLSHMDNEVMWGTISALQEGARPKNKMYLQTIKVTKEMVLEKWILMWFVDFTEAYNRIY